MTSKTLASFNGVELTRNAFGVLSVLYLAAVPWFPQAVFLIKPLLVPVLLIHYILISTKAERFMLRALFFCWVGDIFMMFSDNDKMFLAGMLSFLSAHVLFILSFRRRIWRDTHHGRPGLTLMIMAVVAGVAAYAAYLIFPGAGALQVPILIYVLVIVSMFFNAIRRRGRSSHESFMLLSIGAALFMISDAILGLNRFYLNSALPYNWIWVMTTYLLAMFLLVAGVARHPEERPSVPLPNV